MTIKDWIFSIWTILGIFYYKFIFFSDNNNYRYNISPEFNNEIIKYPTYLLLLDILFIYGGFCYCVISGVYETIKKGRN